jgi:hypothetical protein
MRNHPQEISLTQYIKICIIGTAILLIYRIKIKFFITGLGRFIGGLTQFWAHGYVMGKYAFLGVTVWYTIGVICISLCLAELVSALPFTGNENETFSTLVYQFIILY